jgi:hypothetical protein
MARSPIRPEIASAPASCLPRCAPSAPACRSDQHSVIAPVRGTRPNVGRSPVTPQRIDGLTMLPPVSLPIANPTSPAATPLPAPHSNPTNLPPAATDSSSARQTRYRSAPARPGSASPPAPRPPHSAASPPCCHAPARDCETAPRHTSSECPPYPAGPSRPTESHAAARDTCPPQSPCPRHEATPATSTSTSTTPGRASATRRACSTPTRSSPT